MGIEELDQEVELDLKDLSTFLDYRYVINEFENGRVKDQVVEDDRVLVEVFDELLDHESRKRDDPAPLVVLEVDRKARKVTPLYVNTSYDEEGITTYELGQEEQMKQEALKNRPTAKDLLEAADIPRVPVYMPILKKRTLGDDLFAPGSKEAFDSLVEQMVEDLFNEADEGDDAHLNAA